MKNTIILLCSCLLSACATTSNLNQAKKSLQGTWKVNKIYSAYGQRVANGISTDEEHTETGNLGTFNFGENQVTYQFTRRDTAYNATSSWILNRTKVNQGFTQVEVYLLDLTTYDFVCQFGDQTSDAERNATKVRLIYETPDVGYYQTFQLEMEKQ